MLRFSMMLAAVLALTGGSTIAISPASAYTGEAYNKCMARCQKSGVSNQCNAWCEKNNR